MYCKKTAWEISEYIRNGDITSTEVVQEYFERIHKYDDLLKSYITVLENESLKEAKKADKDIKNDKIRSRIIAET